MSPVQQFSWGEGNAVLSAAALWILWGCDMSCLLKQFASQSSFWLATMCHKASGCTQLKMLFHSSAGLRRKACADVSNSAWHDFPDFRKTSLPAWRSAPAGESLRSLHLVNVLFLLEIKAWRLCEQQQVVGNVVEELCNGCRGYRERPEKVGAGKVNAPLVGDIY